MKNKINHSGLKAQRFKLKNEILLTDANLKRHCESRFWVVMKQSHTITEIVEFILSLTKGSQKALLNDGKK